MERAAPRSLFDLAPDGVYPASAVTLGAVGFYPTISPLPLARRYNFCGTFHPRRFSTGVSALTTERPALRSPDFPPLGEPKSGRYTLPAEEEGTHRYPPWREVSSGVLRQTKCDGAFLHQREQSGLALRLRPHSRAFLTQVDKHASAEVANDELGRVKCVIGDLRRQAHMATGAVVFLYLNNGEIAFVFKQPFIFGKQ